MLLRSLLLWNLFRLSACTVLVTEHWRGYLICSQGFFPKGHCVPDTMEKVQRVVRDLGLDYIKIDACKKDCVLFWKENANLDTCPKCGK